VADVVVDPEVPAAARRELAQAPVSALLAFSDLLPRPGNEVGDKLAELPGKRLAVGGILGVAVVLFGDGLTTAGPFSGDLVFLAMLICLACIVVGGLAVTQRAARVSLKGPAAAYHRRYVVPELDLCDEELARWRRASAAAAAIQASEAVRRGLVDTVEVTAVLPYHLWEIAERLALLSGPQRRQAQILQGLDAGDQDVAAVLEPQRRVRELAVTDIERRISRLEEFAALASRADYAWRRQRAIEELAGLDPDFAELLVRLHEPGSELTGAGGPADELRAAAAEADAAVRRANEAGRGLVIRPPATGEPGP
jgi:hypothetical protein